MQILVALQRTVNQQSMEGLDVQQALLSSFDTLLSSKLTKSAGVLLCRSGQNYPHHPACHESHAHTASQSSAVNRRIPQ